MKIGVTGHQGMLGIVVCAEVLRQGHHLLTWADTSSVMYPAHARRLVGLGSTDLAEAEVIINCAGCVSQIHPTDQELVWNNSYSPQYLATLCDRTRTRLIQVSTDCVFSLPGPHTEASPISPHGMYALSKAAGEVIREPHLTVRGSFIGWGERGLLHDLTSQPQVYASRRLYWSGHTVGSMAQQLVKLAERKDLHGLIHLPGDWTNRYELCLKLAETFGLKAEVIARDDFVADRRLLSTRWTREGLELPPPFEDQLREMRL